MLIFRAQEYIRRAGLGVRRSRNRHRHTISVRIGRGAEAKTVSAVLRALKAST